MIFFLVAYFHLFGVPPSHYPSSLEVCFFATHSLLMGHFHYLI